MVKSFLEQVNLKEAYDNGTLHMVSDAGLRGALKKMNPLGFFTICGLHDVNCVQRRTFDVHLKNIDSDSHAVFLSLVNFFPKARRKDSKAGKSLNDFLTAEHGKSGFTEIGVTRFRSLGNNFDKCLELQSVLINIHTSNQFKCLENCNIEFGAVIAEFLKPITAVMEKLDKDEGHCAGSVFHAYTHLHAYVQAEEQYDNMAMTTDQQSLVSTLKLCLKQALYEQLFASYKVDGRTTNKVPTRMTPADMAACYLWPPSR